MIFQRWKISASYLDYIGIIKEKGGGVSLKKKMLLKKKNPVYESISQQLLMAHGKLH